VAKGIKRNQFSYTMRMYHEVVHVELDKMLEWYIGTKTEFSVSVGMWGQYFKKYLPAESYEKYSKTYSDYGSIWTAVFAACELFQTIAPAVGKYFGFTYNQSDDDNMMEYLLRMKNNEIK
jgi:aminoglycoside 6-adenylyltransferase